MSSGTNWNKLLDRMEWIRLVCTTSILICAGIPYAWTQTAVGVQPSSETPADSPGEFPPGVSPGRPPTSVPDSPHPQTENPTPKQPTAFPAAPAPGTIPSVPAAGETTRKTLDATTQNDLLNILYGAANSFLEPPELSRLARILSNPTYDAETWAAFGSALRINGMSAAEGTWLALTQALLVTSGKDPAVARSLGAIAAGALRDALETRPPDWSAWEITVSFLLHLSGETVTADMGQGMQTVLSRNPLDPEKAWQSLMTPNLDSTAIPPVNGLTPPPSETNGMPFPDGAPADSPMPGARRSASLSSRPGMQTAVALLPYGSPETVADWLVLSPAEKNMLKASACWVFDGGRLQTSQLDQFLRALRAWQLGKMGILALFVGGTPDQPIRLPYVQVNGTVEPGMTLVIPWMPPDAWREPRELVPGLVLPPCPEQTAVLVWECVRTLQAREFQRRPHLRYRRDALLTFSGRTDNELVPFLTTLGWSGHPDDLFPTLAIAWSGGCDTLFPAAAMLQQQGKEGPMAVLLQMADLLSMGKDTTPLMVSRSDGNFSRQETTLRRDMHAPDRPYPVSISWGSETFGWDGSFLENLF